MTVPRWMISRLLYLLGSIYLIASAVVGDGFDAAACIFLMAICTELYAHEDEHTRK